MVYILYLFCWVLGNRSQVLDLGFGTRSLGFQVPCIGGTLYHVVFWALRSATGRCIYNVGFRAPRVSHKQINFNVGFLVSDFGHLIQVINRQISDKVEKASKVKWCKKGMSHRCRSYQSFEIKHWAQNVSASDLKSLTRGVIAAVNFAVKYCCTRQPEL